MKAYTIRGPGKASLIYDKQYVPETDISNIIRFELFKATAEEETKFPQKVIAAPMAKKYCARPDIIAMSIGSFIVTPELRSFIEMLEPDLHHFQPMQVELGGKDLGVYYFLRVSVRLPFVGDDSHEHSRALLQEDVVGHHLWKSGSRYQCSGEFRDRVVAADLAKGWEFTETKIVQ